MAEIHNQKYIFLSRLVIAPAIISLLAAPRVAFCEEKIPFVYPEGALILSILMLFVLGWFFYLVFRWSMRNEQASYLGGIYKDTVLEFEFNRLKVRVVQELHEGKFRREAIEALKTNWEKEGITFEGPHIREELQKYINKGQSGTGGLGGSIRDGGYGGAPGYGGHTTLDDGPNTLGKTGTCT
jgi:hypothetical protein